MSVVSPARSYDYIIVGAGSSGCALAHRLTEDDGVRLLLLEAGGWDRDPWLKIPLAWGRILQRRMYDWMYFAEPEASMGGRGIECARGKVIGGSSSINAIMSEVIAAITTAGPMPGCRFGPMRMCCRISAARKPGRMAPTRIAAAMAR